PRCTLNSDVIWIGDEGWWARLGIGRWLLVRCWRRQNLPGWFVGVFTLLDWRVSWIVTIRWRWEVLWRCLYNGRKSGWFVFWFWLHWGWWLVLGGWLHDGRRLMINWGRRLLFWGWLHDGRRLMINWGRRLLFWGWLHDGRRLINWSWWLVF
ncbi:hypothetical protein P5F54_15145, partial [Clostridium perfringens]|nr:hypothetical protein [Clostridium perfringens]